MIITKINEHPTMSEHFTCQISSNGEVEIRNRMKVFIEDKEYRIVESKVKNYDDIPRIYNVLLKLLPKKTKYDYNNINFMNVYKIERASKKLIKIYQHQITSEIYFNDSEECLNEFLQLKKIQKEALSSG